MKNIAVYIKNYSIGKSSPVLCLLSFLSANYDIVDIYGQNISYIKASVMNNSRVRYIDVPINEKGFLAGIFGMFRPKQTHCYEDTYENHIAFDPHGFVLCMELFPDSRPYYYSLELYFKDNYYNLTYPPSVMEKERNSVHKIKGLIIQSEEREKLFRKEYNLPESIPTYILPVAYLQPSSNDKSTYFRTKYNIDADKKVVLHLGGIQEYYSCIELALSFADIQDCFLVFHGYYYGQYIEELRATILKHNITNVVISDEVFDDIEDMDLILKSSDIGLAWYNDASPNLTTAGRSSGKISAYLRFGLPVITNRYPSCIVAVEQTGCGVCLDAFDGISDGVCKIVQDYDRYSENCRREYDKVYWFDNYRDSLKTFIGQGL